MSESVSELGEWNESAGEWSAGERGRIYAAIATDRMQYWEWGEETNAWPCYQMPQM